MSKILVTGAAGFIGAKLAYELAKRGIWKMENGIWNMEGGRWKKLNNEYK